MKPFNREKFLLWLLAGLLGWQFGANGTNFGARSSGFVRLAV